MEFGPHLMLATLEGAVTAAVLALTAMGLSLVFGVMRVVNVAHGEFYMLGAVLAWWVTSFMGGHPAIGFVAALIIGILYLIQQSTLMSFGPDARPVEPPFNQRLALPWFEWGEEGFAMFWPWGLSITSYKLFVIAAAACVLVALWLVITRTKAGLLMRATQQDSETAQAFGVPVGLVYSCVFGIGAGLAALGAVLVVPIQQAHYLMGHDPLLLAFTVVIIGGLGSLPGTVIAAILIGMSDGIISVFFSPTLAKIIATLLVAMVLVFRPQGLLGRAEA